MIITAFARATKNRSKVKLNRFGRWTSALKVVTTQRTLRIRKLITDFEKKHYTISISDLSVKTVL